MSQHDGSSPASEPGTSSPQPSQGSRSPGLLESLIAKLCGAAVSLYALKRLADMFPEVKSTDSPYLLGAWFVSMWVAVSPASALPLLGGMGRAAVRNLTSPKGSDR